MTKSLLKISIALISFVLICNITSIQTSDAINSNEITEKFVNAEKHMLEGEYNQAVTIFDDILEESPSNTKILNLKGIAQSNLGYHKQSMIQFYNVLEIDPDNLIALSGMGSGFANFGEYIEAKKYFDKALEYAPNNYVLENYNAILQKSITKYPYTPTEKPEILERVTGDLPNWIKNTAGWWASGTIDDSEFISSIQFLIKNKIIKIGFIEPSYDNSKGIPHWVKNNAKWWSTDKIPDKDFLIGIKYLIENGIIKVEMTKESIEYDDGKKLWEFERYLDKINRNISKEKRYIEYPNPSADVIKKFLRDYQKWNFEQQLEIGTRDFPDATYELIDNTYHLYYRVYINEQPSGLPLDHVSTLSNSFLYWENSDLGNSKDGHDVKVHFIPTKIKSESNLWVTWVVRDLGEGVLGHANLKKGVVEVALGGYGCDGSFQLFDVDTVEKIMTHELGHGIGLKHSKNPNSIMYPSLDETKYAYCLLDIEKSSSIGTIVLSNSGT